jgi:NADH-quinone oxidoreductase subunit F
LLEEDCGGIRGGRRLKAVVPGGSSVPVLTAAEAEPALLDYESLAAAGSMLGSAGIIVMDDSTCMVAALRNLARFYSHESCGQCSPCREGTGWAYRILLRLEAGRADASDVDLLLSISRNMRGKTICVLADALAMPIDSYVAKFRDEFDAHAARGGCAGVHPGRGISSLAPSRAAAVRAAGAAS